jgi:molecular chaperone GrpE
MSKHKSESAVVPAAKPSPPPSAAPEGPAAAAAEPLPVRVPPTPPTAEEIEDLKNKAERAQQWYDQLLRSAADLDNYKKRAARERSEAVRFANEALLQKLVPLLDNFDMAMTAANAQNTTVASLQAGVAMIHQQLKSLLADAGLEEIDAFQKPFDPSLHEAVAQEPSAEVPEGHVLRQHRKGYKLRDRLLRPASVVVAKAL